MVFLSVYFASFLLIDYLSKNITDKEQSRYFQITCCFVLLFGFFGFRGLSVLNDTSHYYEHFYQATKYQTFFDRSIFEPTKERFEYGFLVWERFIGNFISKDPYSIIIISALIVTVVNLWFIDKNTNKIAFTILLTLSSLITEYAALRQGYAVCIFLISYKFLCEKKYVPYFLLCIVAYNFHNSALILFALPLITRLNLDKKNVSIVIIAGIAIALLIYPLLNAMNVESHYITSNQERETLPIASIIDTTLICLVLFVVYDINRKFKIKLKDKNIIWMSIMCLCMSIIGIPFLIFMRMTPYFKVFAFLAVARSLYDDNNRETPYQRSYTKKVAAIVALMFLGRLILMVALKNEWHHMNPYNFYDFIEGFHNCKFGY